MKGINRRTEGLNRTVTRSRSSSSLIMAIVITCSPMALFNITLASSPGAGFDSDHLNGSARNAIRRATPPAFAPNDGP